jgi:anti-sigma B factor antagonist
MTDSSLDALAPPFSRSIARQADDFFVVSLAGEIDLYAAPDVADSFQRVSEQGGTRVVVDLSDAEFVDSTFIGLLIAELRRLRSVNGTLVLVFDDPRIMRPFAIAGLERVFQIERTLPGGIAVCGGAGSSA